MSKRQEAGPQATHVLGPAPRSTPGTPASRLGKPRREPLPLI
jgi:hypothetical protein